MFFKKKILTTEIKQNKTFPLQNPVFATQHLNKRQFPQCSIILWKGWTWMIACIFLSQLRLQQRSFSGFLDQCKIWQLLMPWVFLSRRNSLFRRLHIPLFVVVVSSSISWKWYRICQNGTAFYCIRVQNGLKWSKMFPLWSKMVQKWSKMVQSGPKWF